MIKTANFNPDADTKLLCTCGHAECDKRSISQAHLDRIQTVREIVGHSLSVTSGGRCPHHVDEVQRKKPADHQEGNGGDVWVNGATRGNVVRAGIAAGCNAIGIAKTFVHIGYRAELPLGHVTMWVY
jgi:hypothetical protein